MGSAVDEGRNPYGKPGKGNYDEAWARMKEIPCPKCGSTRKEITVDKDNILIRCHRVGTNIVTCHEIFEDV